MNEDRRKELRKALGMIEEAKAIIETCASEEREYYDNMHENLQSGEKGTKADETASALEEMDSTLDDVVIALEEAVS